MLRRRDFLCESEFYCLYSGIIHEITETIYCNHKNSFRNFEKTYKTPRNHFENRSKKRTKPYSDFHTFAKRKRAGFDFLLSVFMVVHYVVGRGVHPMKHICQVPVILKVRLNKKGRKPTGFLYFVFDSGMVELR